MSFFDSSQVTSQAVTLHLCVLELSYTSAYRVELFSLSPEFYHMLKSINDINNNDIGAHGLAFIQPTYTNISGGYGCVAGYGCVKSAWLRYALQNVTDNRLTFCKKGNDLCQCVTTASEGDKMFKIASSSLMACVSCIRSSMTSATLIQRFMANTLSRFLNFSDII